MCIFVTVGVCVYACVCVKMHGGVLMSVFLYLPACMCTCSHLLVWMYVPLNVCVYVFLCTYMHSCCVSLYLVSTYKYVCPCLHIFVRVFMSMCLHACICICIFVCVLDEEDKQRASPLLISLLSQSHERQMLLRIGETSASQSAVTHRPHRLSIAYLPCEAEPLVCFLTGQCASSSSGLQNPCATPSACQELRAYWGNRGTTVTCKAVFWLVSRPAWQETHGRSCNTRACSWGDNKEANAIVLLNG